MTFVWWRLLEMIPLPRMHFKFLRSVLTSGLVVAALCDFGVLGKCPPDNPADAIDYVVVPEDEYDKTFASISSVGKRPLGFNKATWYYNQPDEANPCIRISNATQRRIEIMFETHPRSRLCVKDQVSQQQCSDAGTGMFYECRPAPADVVYLEFFCNQGEEYDVRFWYRLVLGALPAEDPEDHWCDGRQRGDYPASLLQLPSDYPVNQVTTSAPDAALSLQPGAGLVLAASSCLLIASRAGWWRS